MTKKAKDELDQDLKDVLSITDSWKTRIEIILLQILRELKKGNK